MTEIPIVVSDDVVTVGGYTNQVELQLSVGATGERGSRIFTGSVDPTTLPTDSPIWGGYTEFKAGDIYLLRDTDVLEVWEWLYASGEYTWVRTVNDIGGGGGSVTLDPDLDAIANLTGTGLARRTATNTWTLDTAAYLTSNQTITLSGDVSGSGTTSIVTTVADDSHSHTGATISALDAGDVTAGTFNIARIPTGTTGTTVALGSHTHNYVGLVSSTDNAVVRFDGTGGALQNSGVTITDGNGIQVGAATDPMMFRSTASMDVFIDAGTSGCNAAVFLRTGGNKRWFVGKEASGETGSDAGSNFRIWRYHDDGSSIGQAFGINRATGKVTIDSTGSTAGLEFGTSGPRMMMGTGGPSGISAPVGSTWRQTNANTSHGSLTGLLWNKVGTGTAEGTDWLVDYEGRWVTYTPSNANITIGTTGNENTGSYTLTGKTCHARTYVKLGTGGSFSGTANIGLPKTAVAHGWPLIFAGNVYFEDAGVAGYYGWVAITSGATRFTVPYGGASSTINNYIGTGALPFTWGAGDYVLATYTYEIA